MCRTPDRSSSRFRTASAKRALPWTGAAVLLGSILLLGAAEPASASLALIRQGAESRGAREAGDLHGRSLAAGDFNGDGVDDLAVGAPFEDVSGFNQAGAVVVSYGTDLGLATQGAQLLLQSDGDALETGASFGWSLAAGDFDDDGYDDLAVGAPSADYDGSLTNIGYVFVYAGGPGGLSYWHYLWQPGGGGSAETGDRFGASLCAGNFDGLAGSNEDLAVGSPGEDGEAGAIFYFTGGSNGLLNGSSGWRKQSTFGGTNVAGDQFGYSLAAAHVWGAGQEELIVGTPFKEVDGVDDAGVVWVILGTDTGLSGTSAELITPDEEDLPNQPYPDGFFGWAVAGGRFFGGSFDGVAIGEPGRSYFGHPESGRVVVGRGSLLGLSFSGASAITLFQDDAGWALGDDDGFGRALAAGFYDASDGYEDLAIGSPTDNANGGPFGAGVVSILFGGPNGPGAHSWVGWAEDAWRDDVEANDQFGTSLAIGRFDGTDKGNLAIGAPGEDASTGMVCISAPWRQRQYPRFRNGLALDCEGNWVYALRPFDEVCIASTTKIMTVLIACERAGLPPEDPRYVNLGLTYTVPDWIRDNIGGSLYHFKYRQRLSLEDLLHCCMYPSGNDAAFAIADMLTGGNNFWTGSYDTAVPLFVAEMNQRAEQLGMTSTHFTNPAGLDKGGPYSSARDMMLLAQAAMQNTMFRIVVGKSHYEFDSSYVIASVRVPFHDEVTFHFLNNLLARNPLFDGLKPGRTPCAKRTGVFSREWIDDRAFAATFGTTLVDEDDRAPYYDDADAVMDLAIGQCGGGLPRDPGASLALRDETGSEYQAIFAALSTQSDSVSGGAAELWVGPNGLRRTTEVDVLRPGGEGTTRCDLELQRAAELELPPLRQTVLGTAPFQAHGEIVLINHGETSASVLVTVPELGTPVRYELAPGERGVIPAHADPREDWIITIENPSQTETVILGFEESYSWSLTGIPGGMTPAFTADLLHDDELLDESVRVTVTGTDPVPGRTVHVSLHDEGTVVGAPEDGAPGAGDVSPDRASVRPNPFGRTTRIEFDLPRGGDVRLEVFDPAGRRVRGFDRPGLAAGRGGIDWDGTTDGGREVAPGVYFYRLERDGRVFTSGRVVRGR